MALRNPVVDVNGRLSEMPSGDYIKPATLGAGTPSSNTILDGNGNWVTIGSLNYWTLSGSDVYRATGNVYIGHTASLGAYKLQVFGQSYFRNLSVNAEIARFVDITDGSYTAIHNWGISTSRTATYYRPLTNNTQTLYLGDSLNSLRYLNLSLGASQITFPEHLDFKLLKTSSTGVLQQATGADVAALLGVAAAGNYIQNQFSAAQAANAWITGDMRVNGLFVGGFGARTTGGTTNWNHVSNSTSGQGETLLLATHTNGFAGGGNYFHPFNFEYASRNGTGNITQLAIPYGFSSSMDQGLWIRGSYDNVWNGWQRILTQKLNGNWIMPTGNVGMGVSFSNTNLEVLNNIRITDGTSGYGYQM